MIQNTLNGMGSGWNGDEVQIMRYCSNAGRVGLIALNVVCGHFCYTAQENEMIKFKFEHKELSEP